MTAVWVSASVSLILILILVGVIITTVNSMNQTIQFCEKNTPKTMLLTSGINTSLSGNRLCQYESQPQEPFDECIKRFTQTEHHGEVLTLSTCPGGNLA